MEQRQGRVGETEETSQTVSVDDRLDRVADATTLALFFARRGEKEREEKRRGYNFPKQ